MSKTSTENQGLQKPGESITVLKSSGQQITSDLIQENTSIPVEEENNSSVIVVNTTLRPAYEAEGNMLISQKTCHALVLLIKFCYHRS